MGREKGDTSMTIKNLITSYSSGTYGTGHEQVLSITLIDGMTGEILFQQMRVEGALTLLNPNLRVLTWKVKVGTPHKIKHGGNVRESITLEIVAPIMDNVPNYYSDEEWELIREGKELV